MKKVTDPEVLARLEGGSVEPRGLKPVSDPALIEKLERAAYYTPPSEGPVDFSLKQTVKNIPGSIAGIAGDAWSAITNPVDTAKGIGAVAQGVGNKLGRNVAELVHGQEMEPMPERSEDAANAVGAALKNRYGGVDNIKRTIMEDPAGVALDLSGVGAFGAKVLQSPKYASAMAAANPLTVTGKMSNQVAKTAIPKSKAADWYQSAAKFSTTLDPKKRQKMIQTALDEGVLPTPSGMRKISSRIDVLDAEIESMIAQSTNAGKEIPVKAIFRHLNDLRSTKGGVRLGADSDLAAIDRIAGEFHRSLKGRKTVTPEELQFFKKEAYKDINWDAKRMTGAPIKEDTYKAMARGAREAIEGVVPEIAEKNADMGALLELQPHLQRSTNRIENLNRIGLGAPIRTGAGGMVGDAMGAPGLGMGIGAIASFIDNPAFKARAAIIMNRIKKNDVDWLKANATNAEIQAAVALAGRNQELQAEGQ